MSLALTVLGFALEFETFCADRSRLAAFWVRLGRRSAWVEREGLRFNVVASKDRRA